VAYPHASLSWTNFVPAIVQRKTIYIILRIDKKHMDIKSLPQLTEGRSKEKYLEISELPLMQVAKIYVTLTRE
jgi:hypothetical protein